MMMRVRRGTWRPVQVCALATMLACVPSTASASLRADTTASVVAGTASWSAVPTSPGGTSIVTSFLTNEYRTGGNRYALLDVYNNGSVAINGFLIGGVRTAGTATDGLLSACSSGWVPPATTDKHSAPLCDGQDAGVFLGNLATGVALNASLNVPAGGRISLRIESTKNVTWSLRVDVTRSLVP